jgi:ABC-type transporter Mla subunit MlaD
MGQDAEQSAQAPLAAAADRHARLKATQAKLFEALADTADSIAVTEHQRAEFYEDAAARLPDAVELAARARRFAEAEQASASAFRSHELPSAVVRQALRDCGTSAHDTQ